MLIKISKNKKKLKTMVSPILDFSGMINNTAPVCQKEPHRSLILNKKSMLNDGENG